MAYLTSGCPACAGVVAGDVEDAEEVGWYAGEISCDVVEVGEVGCGVGEVGAAAYGLPTTTDGLPSSPGFGEEVGTSDEDPYVEEDAPCASSAPPAHAYSTVKLRSVVADPSSVSLSHAQPRPSSNTTSRATRPRRVVGSGTR